MPIHFLDSPDPTVSVAAIENGKANAIDFALIDALAAAIDGLTPTQALVLTGRAGMFTGGLDTTILETGDARSSELLAAMGNLLTDCLDAPRPIVVAADGHGIAAGAMLMLCADRSIVSDRPAKYGFAEVPNGIPLPRGVVELISAKAHPRATLQLAVHGHLASPAEAVELGLADQVIPATDLISTAIAQAGHLAALPADAYASTKRLAHERLISRMNPTRSPRGEGN